MNRQKGLAVSQLLIWSVVVIVAALLFMSIVPSYIEYRSVKSIVENISNDSAKYKNAAAARDAFIRQAGIDDITSVKADDLKIDKVGGKLVISFEYEKRISLVGNASLVLNYQGSTR
jgi:hypothetical protein